MKIRDLKLVWSPSKCSELDSKMLSIFKSWENTPYILGAKTKKYGVDCVRFCCLAVDELFGYNRCPVEHLPSDTALHSKESAVKAMLKIKRLYSPLRSIVSGVVEPGDLLVVGPERGGPGHLMIVGPEKNTVWHCGSRRVTKTNLQVPLGMELFRIYSFENKQEWQQHL
jgi:cell wall-associated NlpC family hydrolase